MQPNKTTNKQKRTHKTKQTQASKRHLFTPNRSLNRSLSYPASFPDLIKGCKKHSPQFLCFKMVGDFLTARVRELRELAGRFPPCETEDDDCALVLVCEATQAVLRCAKHIHRETAEAHQHLFSSVGTLIR